MVSLVGLLSFVLAASFAIVAQTEPTLTSAALPSYPPLACQARVQGLVKVRFTLPAHSKEPTNVEVLSGNPLLKEATLENVKTWRFDNPYAGNSHLSLGNPMASLVAIGSS